MPITVLRKGYTEDMFRRLGQVSVRLHPSDGNEAEDATRVLLRFDVSAAGAGTSCFGVEIKPEDFESVVQAMMNVDSDAAVKAFGAAMVRGAQQPINSIWDEQGNFIE